MKLFYYYFTEPSTTSARRDIINDATETQSLSDNVEEEIAKEVSPLISSSNVLTQRSVSSSGEAGLGRIQLTLRYSIQRQRLMVVVNKVA